MNHNLSGLTSAMILHERGVPQRIHHFLKVYAFAKAIGEAEGIPESERYILETAALVHDIGIRPSLEKFGSGAGSYQQTEGPPLAQKMLRELGFAPAVIERVCYLVAHHHTYGDIEGADYQILVEADFLVNLYEESAGAEEIQSARDKIFKTKTGKRYLEALFPRETEEKYE